MKIVANTLFQELKKKRTVIIVIILLFMAKFLGFVKNIFMAKYYGTSVLSDAYQMAISIPIIVCGIILYSYQAFTKGFFVAEKEKKANEYTSSFINFIVLILFVITLLLLAFSDEVIYIFAPGFNDSQIYYTKTLLAPIIIGTFFLAIANILTEFLRCKKSYVLSQLSYLIINIVEILTIFAAFYLNYRWLAYGYFIANFLYFLIILFLSFKKGLKYSLILRKKDVCIFIKILFPVFLSSVITDANSMVDKIFASNFGEGIVSTLSYSTNIKTVLLIIAAGFLTVLYPNISKLAAEDKYANFDKKISKSLIFMLLIYVPLTIITIAISKQLVKIVYFRGAFDSEALIKTSKCLIMYTIGILGISLRDLYIKSLYCLEKGNFVIFMSFISVLLNIALNYILSNILGYIGLPLATSLSVWLIIPILIIYYKREIKKLQFNC